LQASAQTNPSERPSRLRLHSQFHSRFLPDDRDVMVYLPADYDENADRDYPVLYMQDGQNLFDAETAFVKGRTWRLAAIADETTEAGEVEPLILVGIANTGERRVAEYTPTHDWKMGGGLADKYGRLLIEELLPFIATNYRIKPGMANAGLGGSSLGALAALYLGLKYSDVFGKLAVLSPSVWWNHRSILSLVNEVAPKLRARPRIWLDVGDAEGKRAVSDTDLLDRRLRTKGWRPGIDLSYERIPGGTHDETAWAERVRPMLRFLFPA
jgi:predicted alpha/beta superfamily hydrolase